MSARAPRSRTTKEPKGDGVTGFPFDAPREGSWKLTLPCTKIEGEQLAEDVPALLSFDPPPTLMTSEPDPDRPDDWQLDAYFETRPDDAAIALIRGLVPSAANVEPLLEHIDEQDWVTLSQAGLEPIRAGRFYVRTPASAETPPAGMTVFTIEAGRAFGTGHHETTTGCLEMIDRLKRNGRRFTDVADVGTGTGLLAFAARSVWPAARVVASDIDPVAIEVTAENAVVNGIAAGEGIRARGHGRLELVTAPGLAHSRLRARAPYDLIIANILAGPLIELAPVLAGALMPGGSLILAGLLDTQADRVAAAYRRQGMRLADSIVRGDWPTLRLVKRRR
ncbi:[LSU ribosomal protein L11P]-lysine N-methyltransferase [Sphingomonas laterariae]|uniref:Ribosomal protein L11 methyltransferase n=1 Tax=Edaphosphingomonas laterariae TaxID=861865 RepID=A0A239F0A2_9SPHN|nr:50S ribosomal protein L11 methyltransferase [Sphingomonas laterariae]SNS49713.1 [LSU ribosomal protein L11P]-lysine N-methyltransferase [Sphingomonas laterariae]